MADQGALHGVFVGGVAPISTRNQSKELPKRWFGWDTRTLHLTPGKTYVRAMRTTPSAI